MGRQSRLREKKRALRHAVATENITVDEANEYYRREKGRVPRWVDWTYRGVDRSTDVTRIAGEDVE